MPEPKVVALPGQSFFRANLAIVSSQSLFPRIMLRATVEIRDIAARVTGIYSQAAQNRKT